MFLMTEKKRQGAADSDNSFGEIQRGLSCVLDNESPRQDCDNKEQRQRRHTFYLRNGFRDINVYRCWDDLEMTIK